MEDFYPTLACLHARRLLAQSGRPDKKEVRAIRHVRYVCPSMRYPAVYSDMRVETFETLNPERGWILHTSVHKCTHNMESNLTIIYVWVDVFTYCI